ncbi:MAG: phosphoribosylglycinamide formyltransferase, partial [Acidimicrobiales bacterium]
MTGPPRLGVLASGAGTLLGAIVEAGLALSVVVTDRPCAAAGVAGRACVPTEVVERESFGADFDRTAYTHRILDVLKRHQVDVVAMA